MQEILRDGEVVARGIGREFPEVSGNPL